MLSDIIDYVNDTNTLKSIIVIILMVVFLGCIPWIKYNKAIWDGDNEKAEYIRSTMRIVCLSIILICFLILGLRLAIPL